MLYVVPTPIGNLKDITYRAVEVLNNVDAILCEDTRTSRKLLNHFEIEKPLWPFHQHNEHKIKESVLQHMLAGKKLALISDAGTPGISDPAYLLINACIENSIKVECLPGATAFVPAVVESGLPSDSFVFEGFLPQKKGRKSSLERLANERRTIILYESPFRIEKLLGEIKQYFPEATKVSLSRELTKIYAETLRGFPDELLAHFKNKPPKGEFVVCINSNFK